MKRIATGRKSIRVTRLSKQALLATALASAMASLSAQAQLAVAENILVDLRATQGSAGTATWFNRGVAGNFSVVSGTPVKQNIGGVDYVTMDPTTQYVGPVAPPTVTGADTRTVEVWVKNDVVNNEDIMIAWGKRGTNGRNYAFTYGTQPAWGALGAWGGEDLGWGAVPAAATLHHLVITYDGATTKLYSDGVFINSESLPLNTFNDPCNFILNGGREGDNSSIQRPNVGNLDYAVIRVHAGALSDTQIAANYAAGVGGDFADADADGLPDFWEDYYLLDKNDNGGTNANFGASGDPDSDGLTNLQEYEGGTAPVNDGDFDGLDDNWEISNFGNIGAQNGAGDPDGDRDDNAAEFAADTDPNDRTSHIDTDSPVDGISDAWEEFYFPGVGTLATDDDDLDGLSSLEEFLRGTNPNDLLSNGEADGDADNDGLDDAWERLYFTNVVAQGAAGDLDLDGASNLAEYNAASNPNVSASTPTDVNGDGQPDTVLNLPFTALGSGGILDATGEATGFTTRLPGTGAALATPNDANLDIDTASGLLNITSTTSDFNGQVGMNVAEAFGIQLSSLGFTGTEDLLVRAKFVDLPALAGFDQIGVYAGTASTAVVRGGLINLGSRQAYAANTNGGGDSGQTFVPTGVLGVGVSMTVELKRIGGVWSLVVNGVNATPGVAPAFLDTATDLNVGVFHADVQSGTQVAKLESFTVVRFGSAVVNLDSDEDGLADAWEEANFGAGILTQSASGDPDGDGLDNLYEFAFNGDPNSSSDNAVIASAYADSNANTNKDLTITIPVRTGATFAAAAGKQTAEVEGITYTVEGSVDLTAFDSAVAFVGKADSNDPDYELHTFRLTASDAPGAAKGFLRAVVAKTPAP
ncbi:MAG: LamG domain-containing protein [Verrucomicrobia bacterium]|nr:MAG: LamG domain-containing protein [Verrucomicrobiota bacterium]TAE87128.1 MAG: LamG domain-containing protein [Verrucomicrobiota bacterium]TAF24932.1 MAG: LamG domain-containing protein [Verrucomicrobiota bacterium]TAF40741.1 MAG: LamG domain-containing protein [Verrucomicrobiota bacterium]